MLSRHRVYACPSSQCSIILSCAIVVSVKAMKLAELFAVVLVELLAFVGAKGMDRRAERIVGVYLLHLARL